MAIIDDLGAIVIIAILIMLNFFGVSKKKQPTLLLVQYYG
ncbi:MAG: hypothetical protein Rpha_1955 [Candidatus Ruthia sp. Apha_13_S6]|nr:hypothetical protein [Candidatus Ruthia sp. Apha_13_S6]